MKTTFALCACGFLLTACGDDFVSFGEAGGGGESSDATHVGPGGNAGPGGQGGDGGTGAGSSGPGGSGGQGGINPYALVILHFDEGNGSTTVSTGSEPVVGTLQSSADWAAGVDLTGIEFPTPGSVDFGDSLNAIDIPFTITTWVKITSGNPTGMAIVATEGNGSGDSAGAWLTLHGESGNTVSIGFGSAAGGIAWETYRDKESLATVTVDTWAHVAGVVTSPDDMTIYIDGLDAGGNYTGSAQSIASTPGSFVVGTSYWGSFDADLHGCVDDVIIFDRALIAEEVAGLAAGAN